MTKVGLDALGTSTTLESNKSHIEMFYNSTRKHSYLGYRSPNEYEALQKVA